MPRAPNFSAAVSLISSTLISSGTARLRLRSPTPIRRNPPRVRRSKTTLPHLGRLRGLRRRPTFNRPRGCGGQQRRAGRSPRAVGSVRIRGRGGGPGQGRGPGRSSPRPPASVRIRAPVLLPPGPRGSPWPTEPHERRGRLSVPRSPSRLSGQDRPRPLHHLRLTKSPKRPLRGRGTNSGLTQFHPLKEVTR